MEAERGPEYQPLRDPGVGVTSSAGYGSQSSPGLSLRIVSPERLDLEEVRSTEEYRRFRLRVYFIRNPLAFVKTKAPFDNVYFA